MSEIQMHLDIQKAEDNAEIFAMLEQRNECLMLTLSEVDYLISYGEIKEARLLIGEIIEDMPQSNKGETND
jgi:hypothetical protein